MTPDQIKIIVEAGGGEFCPRIGDLDGRKYIMFHEPISKSSLLAFLDELTVEFVRKNIKRKQKEFEEKRKHG